MIFHVEFIYSMRSGGHHQGTNMKILSTGERFALYIDAIYSFGTHLLDLSDEMIAYEVFENFDLSAVSDLHKDNLLLFRFEGWIDLELFENTLALRSRFIDLMNGDLRSVHACRHSPEWREIMQLSDQIKQMIRMRWSEDELAYLYTLDSAK